MKTKYIINILSFILYIKILIDTLKHEMYSILSSLTKGVWWLDSLVFLLLQPMCRKIFCILVLYIYIKNPQLVEYILRNSEKTKP